MKTYAYIKLPYTKVAKPERNQKKEKSVIGALKSVISGDFEDSDGVFSTLAQSVSKLNELNSKFSIVAMTQMLKDGKVGSSQAVNYLCTGLAPQLGFTSVALGYQSLDGMKAALTGGDFNPGQLLSSLSSSMNYFAAQETLRNINKEEVIFLDLVTSENFSNPSETAERRVQNGQTLSQFIHNLPPTGKLSCQFKEGANYSKDEFNWQLKYLREKKVPFTLQIGEDEYPGYVLTEYNPHKESAIGGFDYDLSFKKINRGSVFYQKINIRELTSKNQNINIVKNPAASDKTESKTNIGGIKEIWADAKGAYESYFSDKAK